MKKNSETKALFSEAKYRMIARVLAEEIKAGKFAPQSPVPSERALMRRFDVARSTARQAVKILQHAGLICARQGQGWLVIAPQQRKRKIGVLVSASRTTELIPRLTDALQREASRQKTELLMKNVKAEDPLALFRLAHEAAEQMVAAGATGVVFRPIEFVANAELLNRAILEVFDKAAVPVVLLGRDVRTAPLRSNYDVIGFDAFNAGRQLVRHLRETGAQGMRLVVPAGLAEAVSSRMSGVCAELQRSVREVVAEIDPSDEIAVSGLLFGDPELDTLIGANDAVAIELMKSLRRLGLRLPVDMRVAGFEDSTVAAKHKPSLTSVQFPCAALASEALARLRLRQQEKDLPACSLLVPTILQARRSTGGKRRRR